MVKRDGQQGGADREGREERLARQLRENLKRRKAQARARKDREPEPDDEPDGESR